MIEKRAKVFIKESSVDMFKRQASMLKAFSNVKFTDLLNAVADSYNLSKNPDDYIFSVVKACSANIPNSNLDAFPEKELLSLKKDGCFTYETFNLVPRLVEHDDSNIPKTAGGFIIDSYFDDLDPNDKSVIVLLATDAKKSPTFAQNLQQGKIEAFSMGCICEYTQCSKCGNIAKYEYEACTHIKNKYITKDVYEDCYGVTFRELSDVEQPADETALSISTCNTQNGQIICNL